MDFTYYTRDIKCKFIVNYLICIFNCRYLESVFVLNDIRYYKRVTKNMKVQCKIASKEKRATYEYFNY